MEKPVIIIGTPTQGLAISVWQRPHADSADFWDGNWLSAVVDVAVGKFFGQITGDLRAEEFVSFRKQLHELYQSLNGRAEFHTLEGWIYLSLEGDGIGHMKCEGFILDEVGVGNRLAFRLDIDQTFLPALLHGVDAVMQAYPANGRP